jgi:hypothetical protein
MATYALIPGGGGDPWEWHGLGVSVEPRSRRVRVHSSLLPTIRAGESSTITSAHELKDSGTSAWSTIRQRCWFLGTT